VKEGSEKSMWWVAVGVVGVGVARHSAIAGAKAAARRSPAETRAARKSGTATSSPVATALRQWGHSPTTMLLCLPRCTFAGGIEA
jgi:hypothetical protein